MICPEKGLFSEKRCSFFVLVCNIYDLFFVRYLNEIKNIILKEPKILSIEKLIVIKSGPYYKLDAYVFMEGNLTLKVVHRTLMRTEQELKKLKRIKDINIVADPKSN